MNSSFLYHALGLYNHKCTREEYKGNTIMVHPTFRVIVVN